MKLRDWTGSIANSESLKRLAELSQSRREREENANLTLESYRQELSQVKAAHESVVADLKSQLASRTEEARKWHGLSESVQQSLHDLRENLSDKQGGWFGFFLATGM